MQVTFDSGYEEFKESMIKRFAKRFTYGDPTEEILKDVFDLAWKDGFREGGIKARSES